VSRHPRPLAVLAALASAALLALLPVSAASAAPATGWVRVAHLSPDTKQVDVTLSSLSGGTTLYKLSSVGYGNVSPYIKLPTGTYAIAMVPAGAPAGTTPVVKASVTVDAGKAETVAAMGLNKDLSTHVFSDDLAAPSSGHARVNVVQASTTHSTVTVKAGSTTAAADQRFATASSYIDVQAGTVGVTMSAGSTTKKADVSLAAGSIHTLFVLDTSSGGLTVSNVLDSSAAAVTPNGAINTGAGGLAGPDAAPLALALGVVAAAGAAAAGTGLLRRRTGGAAA